MFYGKYTIWYILWESEWIYVSESFYCSPETITTLLISHEVKVEVTQLCPTLCDPMDYTVHGIIQARILEWEAFHFARASSQPRDRTKVSHIEVRLFTHWATRETQD